MGPLGCQKWRLQDGPGLVLKEYFLSPERVQRRNSWFYCCYQNPKNKLFRNSLLQELSGCRIQTLTESFAVSVCRSELSGLPDE